MATASGRSYEGPCLGSSAGARFAVMRRSGYWSPLFLMAARTRSRASLTAVLGKPTRKKFGKPWWPRSTWTSTRRPSRPSTAAVLIEAITPRPYGQRRHAKRHAEAVEASRLDEKPSRLDEKASRGLFQSAGLGKCSMDQRELLTANETLAGAVVYLCS